MALPSFVPGLTVTVFPDIVQVATFESLVSQLKVPPLIFSITSNVPLFGYV